MAKILIIGAGSKIAQELVRLLAEKDNQFYLIARSPEKLQVLQQEYTDKILACDKVDFLDETAMAEQLQKVAEVFDGIDLAVIAHGDLGNQLLSETDFRHAREIYDANCLSVLMQLILLTEGMKAAGHGQIVVLGSVAGERGRPRNFTYGSAKGAVRLYMQGLRSSLYAGNIIVQYIKLGPTDTPMTANHTKNFSFSSPQKVAQLIEKAIQSKKGEVFVPGYWRYVMFVVRNLPEWLFQKLKFLSAR